MSYSIIFIQDSEDSDFETVCALPAAKRVKMMAESRVKKDEDTGDETETDSSSEDSSDNTE